MSPKRGFGACHESPLGVLVSPSRWSNRPCGSRRIERDQHRTLERVIDDRAFPSVFKSAFGSALINCRRAYDRSVDVGSSSVAEDPANPKLPAVLNRETTIDNKKRTLDSIG